MIPWILFQSLFYNIGIQYTVTQWLVTIFLATKSYLQTECDGQKLMVSDILLFFSYKTLLLFKWEQ